MAIREGTAYEGYTRNADSSIICIQCSEGRHSECPQLPEDPATGELPEGSACLEGYYCECGCDYADDGAARDAKALDAIQEMLRDPEWGTGMLEDIAGLVLGTGRTTDNYADNRPTWGRH
jgi:hypothetical protein